MLQAFWKKKNILKKKKILDKVLTKQYEYKPTNSEMEKIPKE